MTTKLKEVMIAVSGDPPSHNWSERRKLFNEVGDNLKSIDTLRRNC